jgi:hypothetical protein
MFDTAQSGLVFGNSLTILRTRQKVTSPKRSAMNVKKFALPLLIAIAYIPVQVLAAPILDVESPSLAIHDAHTIATLAQSHEISAKTDVESLGAATADSAGHSVIAGVHTIWEHSSAPISLPIAAEPETPVSVPEPSTLLLFGVGLVALFVFVRKNSLPSRKN